MGQCGERIRTVLHESVSDRHSGHGGPVVYWSADRSDDKGDHGQRTGAGIYRAEGLIELKRSKMRRFSLRILTS